MSPSYVSVSLVGFKVWVAYMPLWWQWCSNVKGIPSNSSNSEVKPQNKKKTEGNETYGSCNARRVFYQIFRKRMVRHLPNNTIQISSLCATTPEEINNPGNWLFSHPTAFKCTVVVDITVSSGNCFWPLKVAAKPLRFACEVNPGCESMDIPEVSWVIPFLLASLSSSLAAICSKSSASSCNR